MNGVTMQTQTLRSNYPRYRMPIGFSESYLRFFPLTEAYCFVHLTPPAQYTSSRPIVIDIERLPNKRLITPLSVILEPDGDGFIARTPDLPLYGFAHDSIEAINSLRSEIESLYEDLMEDDEFSEDWLKVKQFLRQIVAEK